MIAHGLRYFASTSRQRARDPQPPLDRLVRIGHPADRHHLRLPARRAQRLLEQLGRVLLHEDVRLEVEPGGEAEVLVGGARVAVVRGEAGGEERARRGLDVDDVAHGPGSIASIGSGSRRLVPESPRTSRDRGSRSQELSDARADPTAEVLACRPGVRSAARSRALARSAALARGRRDPLRSQRVAAGALSVEEARRRIHVDSDACVDSPRGARQHCELRQRARLDLPHRASASPCAARERVGSRLDPEARRGTRGSARAARRPRARRASTLRKAALSPPARLIARCPSRASVRRRIRLGNRRRRPREDGQEAQRRPGAELIGSLTSGSSRAASGARRS